MHSFGKKCKQRKNVWAWMIEFWHFYFGVNYKEATIRISQWSASTIRISRWRAYQLGIPQHRRRLAGTWGTSLALAAPASWSTGTQETIMKLEYLFLKRQCNEMILSFFKPTSIWTTDSFANTFLWFVGGNKHCFRQFLIKFRVGTIFLKDE